MIEFVEASPAHLRRIANNMGRWDQIECEAGGRSPIDALRASLRGSVHAWSALLDKVPVAMWGVCPISEIDSLGCPWMLGTDAARQHARAFVEGGRRTLPIMQQRFARLQNHVALGHKAAIKLLSMWGFLVGGEVTVRGGVEFIPFVKERDYV